MADKPGKHEQHDNFNPGKKATPPDPKHVPKHEKPEGDGKK